MDHRPATSVILPTVRPTPVIDELADQLGEDDELLVVCDSEDDPVATAIDGDSGDDGDDPAGSTPTSTRLVVAGEPEGCSGKANAIAAGMAAAEADRLVWTDDDFHHPPGWLEALSADYDRQGPTTELPFFAGRDALATLCEPLYALGATAGLSLFRKPWAGAVIFERGDLDERRFRRDLRRTVSDDGLLSLYLDVTPVRRVRHVPVGGTVGDSLERHVRFMQIVWRFAPNGWAMLPLSALFCLVCLLAPIPAAVGSTLVVAGVYARFGVRRPTALLAYPALIAALPLVIYSLARREFVWGGRRYRWRRRFSVTVADDA
jgi:glycosyltransferase involved in cell wall biosynthesis